MIGSWSFHPELGAMSRGKGFSLVELAVSLAIIALLLAGALIPLSAQIDVRNGADTQRSMESIRDAVMGFAQANGRLPCPANGATPAGTVDTTTWATAVGAGAEQWDPPNNRCYTVFGVVPCDLLAWRLIRCRPTASAGGLARSTGTCRRAACAASSAASTASGIKIHRIAGHKERAFHSESRGSKSHLPFLVSSGCSALRTFTRSRALVIRSVFVGRHRGLDARRGDYYSGALGDSLARGNHFAREERFRCLADDGNPAFPGPGRQRRSRQRQWQYDRNAFRKLRELGLLQPHPSAWGRRLR